MDKTKASVAMFSRQTHIFIINLLALTVYSKHTSFMRRADKLSTCLHGKDLLNPPPWTEEQVVFTSSPQPDVAVPTFPGWFIYSQRTGVERTRVVVVAAGSMGCNIHIYLHYICIYLQYICIYLQWLAIYIYLQYICIYLQYICVYLQLLAIYNVFQSIVAGQRGWGLLLCFLPFLLAPGQMEPVG